MNVQDKIEALKVAAAESLEKQIAKVVLEDKFRFLAPNYDAPKGVTTDRYDGVADLRYEVPDAVGVLEILKAYREKYGAFKAIGKYTSSCTVVTAYPVKEYAELEPVKVQDDAVEARNNKGRGFTSTSFTFYPVVPGEKVSVTIDLAYRAHVAGFEGYINANYNRSGDITNVEKRAPAAHIKAGYTVPFGGGSRDSADWRGVFSCGTLVNELLEG